MTAYKHKTQSSNNRSLSFMRIETLFYSDYNLPQSKARVFIWRRASPIGKASPTERAGPPPCKHPLKVSGPLKKAKTSENC